MSNSFKNLTDFIGKVLLIFPDITYTEMVLLTWQLYDGIEIPEQVCKDVLASGSSPETISRKKRFNAPASRRRLEVERILDILDEEDQNAKTSENNSSKEPRPAIEI